MIFGSRRPTVFLFSQKRDIETNRLREIFREASNKVKNAEHDVSFVVSDVVDGIQKRLAEFIGVDERDLPTIRILDPSTMKKYLYMKELSSVTSDDLHHFYEDFKKDLLQPFYRSKEEPQESSALDYVKHLVGKNFYKEVIESAKDVIVVFYTPWC